MWRRAVAPASTADPMVAAGRSAAAASPAGLASSATAGSGRRRSARAGSAASRIPREPASRGFPPRTVPRRNGSASAWNDAEQEAGEVAGDVVDVRRLDRLLLELLAE